MGVVSSERSNCGFRFRHVQALLLFMGFFLTMCIRSGMSLAVVAMTDKNRDGTFNWTLKTQNVILSSFNWGYIILLIPGGELARKFGGMPLLTTCVGVNAVACLLMPVAGIYGGWQAVCACRVIQGLGQGLKLPATAQLMSKWVPLEEKGRFSSFIFSGGHLGTAVQLIISGYIADIWDWSGIFYVDGVIGIIWTVVFIILGSNSPQTSKIISQEERFHIQNSLQQVGEPKKLNTPWKALMTSLPFWSLVMSTVGFNWGFFTLLTQIPSYMQRILDVDIISNGILSAVPYLALCLLCFPMGYLSDFTLKRKWVSITWSRKIFNSIAIFGPALALIALCYTPPDIVVSVTLLSVAVGLTAAYFSGETLVYFDMAPNFASVLIGWSHGIGNIVALNAPLVVNLFVRNETEPKEWHNVFYLAAGIYIITNIIFLIFGTSQRQTWNEPGDDMTEAESNEQKSKQTI